MHPGNGLEGISIGPSEIGLVDGENGQLIYRGHDAEVLVRENCFEEVAYLLWTGRLPNEAERQELRDTIFAAMRHVSDDQSILNTLNPDAIPMDSVRSAISAWGCHAPPRRGRHARRRAGCARRDRRLRRTARRPPRRCDPR
jgi:citrate synthase